MLFYRERILERFVLREVLRLRGEHAFRLIVCSGCVSYGRLIISGKLDRPIKVECLKELVQHFLALVHLLFEVLLAVVPCLRTSALVYVHSLHLARCVLLLV